MSYILHVDMNSYFASVEQQANPLLRGRPVGVVAYLSKNGCILASSKEAKAHGVKTGCSVAEARIRCPDITFVENDPAKYTSTTKKIFSIFSEYTGTVEPYSIDEAFLDLTGYISSYAEGEQLIRTLQRRIQTEIGEWLTCSAGLSWTRWLAKFGSDTAAKGSYQIIDSLDTARVIYDRVEITGAWGIGARIAERLRALHITNLSELQRYPVTNLRHALGQYGYQLWANVNGIPTEAVHSESDQRPKSIGHSYCVPKKSTDLGYAAAVLMKLCEKTGRRLRAKGLEAYGISAGFTLHDGTGHWRQTRLTEPIQATREVFEAAFRIVSERRISAPYRMFAVSATRLAPVSGQQSLFCDQRRRRSVAAALDAINDRYGEYTVIPGTMWGMGDQALHRIGFRKSVDDFRDMSDEHVFVDE